MGTCGRDVDFFFFFSQALCFGNTYLCLKDLGGLAFTPYAIRTERARSCCVKQELGKTPRKTNAFCKTHL